MNDRFFVNDNKTVSIEYYLKSIDTYDEFEKRFAKDLLNDSTRIGEYLDMLLCKYNQKASVLSVEAGLGHAYVGNLINGKRNNPTRDVLIRLCLIMGTTLEEVQYLLKYAGQAPLYARRRRDVIIWFGFMKNESLDTVNENLINRNLKPLYQS